LGGGPHFKFFLSDRWPVVVFQAVLFLPDLIRDC
jgi:hypothetical protein